MFFVTLTPQENVAKAKNLLQYSLEDGCPSLPRTGLIFAEAQRGHCWDPDFILYHLTSLLCQREGTLLKGDSPSGWGTMAATGSGLAP